MIGRVAVALLAASAATLTATPFALAAAGEKKMIPVDLALALERSQVLPGERVTLRVTLRNTGAEPLAAPSPKHYAPFVYWLTPEGAAQPRYRFSAARWRTLNNPDDRSRQERNVELAPGALLEFAENSALVFTEPVAPGRYAVRVSLSTESAMRESPPVPLEVAVPRVQQFAAYANQGLPQLSHVFVDGAADAVTTVRHGFSAFGNPVLMAHERRGELAAGTHVSSVAVAVEGQRVNGGEWIGWLAGAQLSAALGSGREPSRRGGPVDTGLTDALLLSPARELADRRGQFLVVGRRGNEHVLKEVVLAAAAVADPNAPTTRARPPARAGAAVAAPQLREHLLGTALPGHLHVRHFADAGPDRYELVGTHTHAGNSRLIVWRPGADRGYRLVFQLTEPVAAFAVPPVQAEGEGYADLLVGPTGAERRMTLLRVGLDDGRVMERRSFDEAAVLKLAGSNAVGAPAWRLAEGHARDATVLAQLGGRLVAGAPAGANDLGWTVLGDLGDDARVLAFVSTARPDRYGRSAFAMVTSPRLGLWTVPVPR